MRAQTSRALLALIVALTAVGCYHDKYGMGGSTREDYVQPPDEPRYNEPDTAKFRVLPKLKQDETLMNRGRGGPGPGGTGGGPGGF